MAGYQKDLFVIQILSRVRLFVTPWTRALQASLSFTISQNVLRFMSIELVVLSNYPFLCRSLLLLAKTEESLPASGSFPMSSALRIGWPKYWSSSFSNSPSNKYSGLISFRTDWFDLLGVQGILKRLLQHHIVKVSVLVFESRSN